MQCCYLTSACRQCRLQQYGEVLQYSQSYRVCSRYIMRLVTSTSLPLTLSCQWVVVSLFLPVAVSLARVSRLSLLTLPTAPPLSLSPHPSRLSSLPPPNVSPPPRPSSVTVFLSVTEIRVGFVVRPSPCPASSVCGQVRAAAIRGGGHVWQWFTQAAGGGPQPQRVYFQLRVTMGRLRPRYLPDLTVCRFDQSQSGMRLPAPPSRRPQSFVVSVTMLFASIIPPPPPPPHLSAPPPAPAPVRFSPVSFLQAAALRRLGCRQRYGILCGYCIRCRR